MSPQHDRSPLDARIFALRRMWALGFGVVLLGLTFEARAEGGPSWLESYRVPPACPSASSFREQVEQRLAGDLAALGRAGVSVAISRDGSSEQGRLLWRSELSIGESGQPATSIEVADGSCAALVQALALVVALRVDGAPEPAPTAIVAVAPDEPASPMDGRVAPTVWARGSPPFRVGAGVLASVRSPLGPEPAPGVGVGVAMQWAISGVWAPRLEVSASRLATGEVALSGAMALRFDALLATASVCPLRGLGTEAFWLRPCLDLEAGQLTGRGSGPTLVRSEARSAPWLAPGASLRAAAIPFGGPIELSASVGASFPLFRHEFYFAPNIEGFSVPAVGWNGSGQAAWLF